MQKDDPSFSALFRAHPVPMWIYDLETLQFQAVNAAAISHYGYSEAEFRAMTIKDIRPPQELARLQENLLNAPRDTLEKSGIWQHRKKDGALISVEISSHPLTFNGRACKFVLAHDVTEQLQAQAKITRLNRIYAVSSGISSAIVRIHQRNELFQETCRIAVHEGAFNMAWIGVIDPVTLEGTVVAASGGTPELIDWIKLTGRSDLPESLRPGSLAIRQRAPVICNDVATDPRLTFIADELLANGHRATAALPLIRDGRAVAVFTLLADVPGYFDAAHMKLLDDVVADLNFALEFIDNAERLSYVAYYDTLTGLANGKLFEDRVAQAIHAHKADHQHIEVVLINVDRFSLLNDALGRHAGDEVLKEIGRRLGASLQGANSLARIGGATFAAVLADPHRDRDTVRIIEQDLFAPLALPFRLQPQDIRISVRAGVAQYPGDGKDAETLFKHAEIALMKAKAGAERYVFYAPAMNAAHALRLALESDLQRALDDGEFEVHYQPRVDLASGRMVSAEALIRWNHPQRGRVAPASFIPLAEEIGLIVPIGQWVLNTVCAQQSAWLRQGLGAIPIAVNLSAVQFTRGRIVETIRSALAAHALMPEHIEFEITESMVMNDPEEAASSLQALKELGTQLSLDDFGTGYSSLAYLQRFPFDCVKIDRSFITNIASKPGDAAIVTAVIAMAHSLQLRVVAEGVETEEQLSFLRKRGCDEIQGYLFSRAVPADAFEALLREGRQLAPAASLLSADNGKR
jgi:diguanylate cyclase (GGDEF)-like protein/PAS domain S-box-containing protein